MAGADADNKNTSGEISSENLQVSNVAEERVSGNEQNVSLSKK